MSFGMQIWVDADACPRAIKDILYRAAKRVKVRVILVANRPLLGPRSGYVRVKQVPSGFDRADHEIVGSMQPGDLVVTSDIPLAAAVVGKGGHALGFRGEPYTEENIGERLAMRDLMDHLRSTGVETGGPSALGKSDRQAFANALDRFLARRAKSSEPG